MQVEMLRIAALNAVQAMSGGKAKTDLRDAYDATPAQCLRDIQEKALQDLYKFGFTPEQYHTFKHSKDGLALQAEAGRTGFVAGYHKMHIEFVGSVAPIGSAEHAADQYTNLVRKGAKP